MTAEKYFERQIAKARRSLEQADRRGDDGAAAGLRQKMGFYREAIRALRGSEQSGIKNVLATARADNDETCQFLVKRLRWTAANDECIFDAETATLAAQAIEALQAELEDERYRHDKLQDWDAGMTAELERVKAAAIDRLAHYEDLEEQGRLVELPVAFGSQVYLIFDPWADKPLKSVLPAEINGIKIYGHGVYLNILFDTKAFNGSRDYEIGRIGKTVFLSREEAEAAL